MPALPLNQVLDTRLIVRDNAASNSTSKPVPSADNADPQPTSIHFSTLTLIIISIAICLVLVIVAVLVYFARRQGKVPKFAISKPERRESARTWVAPSSSTADLKVLQPGLPDPPSFAGRFSYYNASGGVVSLKNVVVEDEVETKRGFGTTSRDRAWLLDQSAISPVSLTFSPAFPARHDSSFADGLSDYSRPRSEDPLRGSDIVSYYLNGDKPSPSLPSVPSPAYSPLDPMRSFHAGGTRVQSPGLHASASEFSISGYGEPFTGPARLTVQQGHGRSRHRVSNAPPRIPTLVGLDVFSTIGTAMMDPASPLVTGTPMIRSHPLKPAKPARETPRTPQMSAFDGNTPRSHFSPPTPILSPVPEETRRASNFSFSGFYGSYGPSTPQPGRGVMPRSGTVGRKYKHRRFSSEVDARFAVGLGLDFSRRAGYI